MDKTVIKIGGSLALHPMKLKSLCTTLAVDSRSHGLVVVPGGGEFADVVRDVDKRFKLSSQVSHKMAILGMDQYGFLLSELLSGSCLVNELSEAQSAWDSKELAVFLPSRFFLKETSLENSWDVTSDSIAAYISGQLDADKLVLATDVDGVFTFDPKNSLDAKLIDKLSAAELLKMNLRTSVDKVLPKLLLKFHMECFVVNGLFPKRVEAILKGQKTVCTIIS